MLSTDVIQLTLALKMTTAQVFETSVTVKNTPFQYILNLPIDLRYQESITENNGES